MLFASFTRKPKPWHFGLRPDALLAGGGLGGARDASPSTRWRRSTRVIVQPDAEQSGRPGPRSGPGHLRPDRGGLHGHLRGARRRGVLLPRLLLPGAAEPLLDARARPRSTALLFGVIHYDFSGADALLILPPLAILGFIFCLVYERTGSIYPVIAMHSFNNAIAFGVTGRRRVRVARARARSCCSPAPQFREHSGRPWHSGRHMSEASYRSRLVLIALASGGRRSAQTPTAPTTPDPARGPAAGPGRRGKATLSVEGGLATKKARYYAPAQEVVVRGVVKPYVPDEVLTLYAIRGKKASKTVRRARRARGAPTSSASRSATRGRCGLWSSTSGSAAQQAFRTRSETIQVVNWSGRRGRARPEGAAAPARPARARLRHARDRLLRRGTARGERVPQDERDGPRRLRHHVGLREAAARPGRVQAALPDVGHHGKHVEFDWSRQVLVLADNGKPYRSTTCRRASRRRRRCSAATTSTCKTPGTNSHGMVYSIVLHRRLRDPRLRRRCRTTPASHGCLRVPIPNAVSIYNWIDIGDPIYTYP